MALNAPSFLQSMLLGFTVFSPIVGDEMKSGSSLTIYSVEMNGSQERTYSINIMGK